MFVFFTDYTKESLEVEGKYDFVEPLPDEFKIPGTEDALTEPYLTSCGHYVHVPNDEALQRIQSCPVCQKLAPSPVPNQFRKNQVQALTVYCRFRNRGCSWSGAMSNLKQHILRECNYLQIFCPIRCGKVVRIGRLEVHATNHCPERPFRCAYCNHTSTYQEIINRHQPNCAIQVMQCPNMCGADMDIQRQHMEDHLKSCPLEMIDCEYSFAGCEYRCKRQDMPEHIACGWQSHLNFLASHKDKILLQLNKLLNSNHLLMSSAVTRDHIYIPSPEIQIDNFNEFCYNSNPYYSVPFYSKIGGHKMHLKVYHDECNSPFDGHIYVDVCTMQGEFDAYLCSPFCGEVTVQLYNHNEASSRYERKFLFCSKLDGNTHITQKFISIDALRKENDYLKDGNVLLFRVCNIVVKEDYHAQIKPIPSTCMLWTGFLLVQHEQLIEHVTHFPHTVDECDCCIMERLSQNNSRVYFSALSHYVSLICMLKNKLEVQSSALKRIMSSSFRPFPEFIMNNFMKYYNAQKSWYSMPFYSHFNGYKLCLRVAAYGYAQCLGTQLCVVVILMKGTFDNYLKFPFYGDVTVQMVDQASGKNLHYEATIEFHEGYAESVVGRPKHSQNEGIGELNYFPLHELLDKERLRFLKNNSLCFKITRIVIKELQS